MSVVSEYDRNKVSGHDYQIIYRMIIYDVKDKIKEDVSNIWFDIIDRLKGDK